MDVSPGWKSSELYVKLFMAALIAFLTKFHELAPGAGLPPWFAAVEAVVVPAILGWLAVSYTKSRTEVKVMASKVALAAAQAGAATMKTVVDR